VISGAYGPGPRSGQPSCVLDPGGSIRYNRGGCERVAPLPVLAVIRVERRAGAMNSGSDERSVSATIEHTLLAATATAADIDTLCAEASEHGFAAVCVNPIHVARCRDRLQGTGVRVVTVIGFPLGANRTPAKAFECELAIADGADEIDTVMQLGAARAGEWALVLADLRAVVQAAQGRAVKLILETVLWDDAQKRRACELAVTGGAAYVKTSTGYGPGGANEHDVRLLRQSVGESIRVKASGGIRTAAQARALIAAGADRLGTSAGVQIVTELG
jgi:deoxyribose-phosphate aldolase